jgi:hypothetical protein
MDYHPLEKPANSMLAITTQYQAIVKPQRLEIRRCRP